MLFSMYEYPNPADHKAVLQNINDAIVAYASGWSVVYNCADSEWALDDLTACNDGVGGNYGFMSGVSYAEHHNLAFENSGYGGQVCHVRMRADEFGTYSADAEVEFIQCGGWSTGQDTIDWDSTTDPVNQNNQTNGSGNWMYGASGGNDRYRRFSLKPSTMVGHWVFINDQYLISIVQVDSFFFDIFTVGIPELFDTSMDVAYGGVGIDSQYQDRGKWNAYTSWPAMFNLPWGRESNNCITNGVRLVGNTSFRQNIKITTSDTALGDFSRMTDILRLNNFSGKRPLAKPLLYFLDSSDSKWKPFGYHPMYYIAWNGLSVTQILKYGTEEYIVFPNYLTTRAVYAIAIRIK